MAVCRQDMLYKDYTSNPIPTYFLLQTAILNNPMACIACKIISGIKNDVGMGLLV